MTKTDDFEVLHASPEVRRMHNLATPKSVASDGVDEPRSSGIDQALQTLFDDASRSDSDAAAVRRVIVLLHRRQWEASERPSRQDQRGRHLRPSVPLEDPIDAWARTEAGRGALDVYTQRHLFGVMKKFLAWNGIVCLRMTCRPA